MAETIKQIQVQHHCTECNELLYTDKRIIFYDPTLTQNDIHNILKKQGVQTNLICDEHPKADVSVTYIYVVTGKLTK